MPKQENTLIKPPSRVHLGSLAPVIPHTVWTQKSFRLDERVALFELPRKNASKTSRIISDDEQVEQWNECVASCKEPFNRWSGWTACFAGTSAISFAETAAANLAAMAMVSRVPVAWVDLSEAIYRRSYNPKDFCTAPEQEPFLTVVTGLRFDSPQSKFERAFDMLRAGMPNCNRVVVATGAGPIEVMSKIGLPVQRLLNFSPTTTALTVG